MRDSVFRKPGPVRDLEFSLRILAGKRILFLPVPLERVGALGNLFPLLLGRYAEHEIKARLSARLACDDDEWATEIFSILKSEGCLEPARCRHETQSASRHRP